MEHPPTEVLRRFLLGEASRAENQLTVRHLLARCPACAATLQQLGKEPPLGPPPSPEAYDPALAHAAALAAAADRPQSSATTGNTVRRRWLFG